MLLISFLSISCSIILSPSPSIFIQSLETKCIIFLINLAGHSIPIHLLTASPSSRITGAPHTGQTLGISNISSVPFLFSFFTSKISGITSPAFCTTIVSPTLISFSLIKSSLCNVVLDIVEPATFTGFNIAIGVIAPVLPTWQIISSSLVSFFSGGYLYAIAHLGTLEVVPIFSLNFKLSTFITAPSIPKVNSSLSSPIFFIASIASGMLLHDTKTGFTLNPSFFK